MYSSSFEIILCRSSDTTRNILIDIALRNFINRPVRDIVCSILWKEKICGSCISRERPKWRILMQTDKEMRKHAWCYLYLCVLSFADRQIVEDKCVDKLVGKFARSMIRKHVRILEIAATSISKYRYLTNLLDRENILYSPITSTSCHRAKGFRIPSLSLITWHVTSSNKRVLCNGTIRGHRLLLSLSNVQRYRSILYDNANLLILFK